MTQWDPLGFAAVLAVVALVGVGVWYGQRWVGRAQWSRPVTLSRRPVPESWAERVRELVPMTALLPEADFARLLKFIQVFLAEKNIEGAGGLEVTDDMRLSIAAQACLLVLWMEVGLFPGLKTVIVYPSTVVPRYTGHGASLEEERGDPILGQSWEGGIVILAWDSADSGASDPRDGHNVVLHEFAHQLDQEDGAADGVPVGMPLSAVKPWATVLREGLRDLRRREAGGLRSVMDKYGATNEAEFFAVASETFFEKATSLRKHEPDLYDLLKTFYRVDPAEGFRKSGS